MTSAEDTAIKVFENEMRDLLSREGWAASPSEVDLLSIFKPECFAFTESPATNDLINRKITDFSKAFIAGDDQDFSQFKAKLKSYDFSATCGLVWTTNYFAYRCRTCCLSPSMSLCAACFNNGNHVGHDFNKFKSQAGGACDCGNGYVMKEFGYCRHHGPSKLSQQRDPPDSLMDRFKLLIPLYLKRVLFASWSLIQTLDVDDSSINVSGSAGNNSDVLLPVLSFINELLTCGWVAQKIISNVMIDQTLFNTFINDSKETDQYYAYECAIKTNPGFKFPEGKIGSQQLQHQNLVDAFMFVCVKLRFPENLITFLIGLLTIDSYKDTFVHSYLNHYSRMASTILIHAKTIRNGQDASYNMNNRIVHISVQLFSGEILALKMVKERDLHYLIVHCLLNMFNTALTRLDTNDTNVINCETPMIQNNVFWPLISDLTNLVTHKSVVDVFINDADFMNDWTKLLKWMQFMNFFVLKEGNHIEYETMAFFHAFTMEIEISANSMWNIWNHYRAEKDKESALNLIQIFINALSNFLENLGTFETIVLPHPSRKPLSFHLPLMRNVACFLSLGLIYHNLPLTRLLETVTMSQMIRWFEETSNTLLGCQEVLIGYWIRNGQSVRTSTTYYIHNQFCYALIDMDIFASQVCASVIPNSTLIFILTDPSQLLKGITFTLEYKDKPENVTGKSHFQAIGCDRFGMEKQPLALEAWLMNLCWLLDLRNEMKVDDAAKLRREVCSQLCPDPIKRSDLSHRLPERTGINIQISADVDSILTKVANYTAPSFDEYSGNLQSGVYTFKPELWDIDYDPIFQSLRSVTKRDAVDALSKYREYYRQKQNVAHSNSLWPPYRNPLPPNNQLSKLENILHCKDFTYILFCCLSMFVNNDPVVTEDSLALIIHLILRSLTISETQDNLDEVSDFHKTRFPENPYKVNDAWINIRYKVDIYAEVRNQPDDPSIMSMESEGIQMDDENKSIQYQVVQRESIISLLLKSHAKLHMLRLQSGGKSLLSVKSSKLLKVNPASNEQSEEPMETDFRAEIKVNEKVEVGMGSSHNNSDLRRYPLDLMHFNFFREYPLVYDFCMDNLQKASEKGVGINWGDGVDFIGHLLDVIASKDDENSKCLLEIIEDIKHISAAKMSDTFDSHMDTNPPEVKKETNARIMDTVNEKKQKAQDRRRRVIANMAMKQKAFATIHQLDLPEVLVKEEDKEMFECVICQLKSNPNKDKMVILGILCSAGLLKYMQDQPHINTSEMNAVYRKDYMDKIFFKSPILSHSLIIQTCGHVVHQDCFDKYKAQRPAVTRMRRTITCPLCRRDVHHLTPIQTHDLIISSPDTFYSILKNILFQSFHTIANAMQTNIIEDTSTKNQLVNISVDHQACSLLRSQLELELTICLTVPEQYNTIIRRCAWPEFISYLRTLNANIDILIKQCDSLLGTSFWDEIPVEERNSGITIQPFLFNIPSDVLLNFVPYLCPHEDQFLHILKACILMAYIKGMVMEANKLDESEYSQWSKLSADADDFQQHFALVLRRCQLMFRTPSIDEVFSTNVRTYDIIVGGVIQSVIPLLRISAMIKTRLMKLTQIPNTFPIVPTHSTERIDYFQHFKDLCSFLDLSATPSSEKSSANITNVISSCIKFTLFKDFADVVNKYISEEFIELYVKEKHNLTLNDPSLEILNVGNELYPPHLIELPSNYDDLFNAYHSHKCIKGLAHVFPENGLCLICGKIVCLICDSMPLAFSEHSKTCCFGVGLIIDLNTSIIHVLLNNEISQWGSVYLDYYGEEDLELKRGRPLFINSRRFILLEQQWLTHSFKHVVKSWRRVS